MSVKIESRKEMILNFSPPLIFKTKIKNRRSYLVVAIEDISMEATIFLVSRMVLVTAIGKSKVLAYDDMEYFINYDMPPSTYVAISNACRKAFRRNKAKKAGTMEYFELTKEDFLNE